ncbi:MAG: glycosyltransferase [Victivallaceae bacterium]|nr:glycosyltransferase [Victivallaceae bacterium]
MMEKIPIILITDHNYVLATRIAIRSLFKYKHMGNRYAVVVLGVSLHPGDAEVIKSEGPDIEVRDCDPGRYSDIQCLNHVSTAALFKFDLPQLFPQYDKVIYVDSDVLILDDLSRLYSFDLAGCYAAMVKDYRAMAMLKFHEKMQIDNYYFSGLFVADLSLWRRDGMTEKMIELKRHNTYNGCMDQDVFNVAFAGRILTLPVNYNCPAMLWWGTDAELSAFYSGDELSVMRELRDGKIVPGHIVVLHYFMRSKPWVSLRNSRPMRYWWRFLTPSERVKLYSSLIVKKIQKVLRCNK